MTPRYRRVILLVLDSVGVGAMPDADRFGDAGSDTLGHVAEIRALQLPRLRELGIGNIRSLRHLPPASSPLASFGRMALASAGKDTTSGHWEMMGLILDKPFPVYPEGFPEEVIGAFEREIGRPTLGNRPASGTQIIEKLGSRHLETGFPIVYTSADSVFQIAAHEEVIAVDELYRICETARRLLRGPHQVGRVIARPFRGEPGGFRRTANRKDFAVPPFIPTVLDELQERKIPVFAVGKIASIYCYRGIGRELRSRNNRDTADKTLDAMGELEGGLIFSNFVDFDALFGHRNDAEGYARALEEFDADLARLLRALRRDDLLVMVSDHGCDPTTPSTDHSREYALLLAYSPSLSRGNDLGTRSSLADTGATLAENFGVPSPAGTSFLEQL